VVFFGFHASRWDLHFTFFNIYFTPRRAAVSAFLNANINSKYNASL
jgi:hypothetical protein